MQHQKTISRQRPVYASTPLTKSVQISNALTAANVLATTVAAAQEVFDILLKGDVFDNS